MKRIILSLAVLSGCFAGAAAQSKTVSNANEEAVKNYDGTAGHFEYALNSRERVNVNFALTPRTPVQSARFALRTPDPMPFSATIVDASGKIVYRWKPEQTTYFYNADWNLDALKSGSYTVKIFLENDPKSIHEFQFSKG
ncbi:MAG TPA: hypothetical protein VL092_03380 [Chitinophagaceae bacterium]|nr:hypothetical protein [Chitinophagaceae bacterium]